MEVWVALLTCGEADADAEANRRPITRVRAGIVIWEGRGRVVAVVVGAIEGYGSCGRGRAGGAVRGGCNRTAV